jgi:signal transduction histidine kinase
MDELETSQESIHYLAQLLDHLSDAVIAVDLDSNIQYWSKGAEQLYGWTRDEVYGKALGSLLKTDGTTIGEIIHYNRSDRPLHVSSHESPLYDRNGSLIGHIFVNRDITSQKAHEDQFELLKKQHELIAVFSNAFHSPLAVILSSVDILLKYSDRLTPDERQERLDRIRAQVNVLKNMVDDLRMVNMARDENLTCKPTPFDLNAFCEAVIEEFHTIDDRNHPIELEYTCPFLEVILDRHLLRNILTNLLYSIRKSLHDRDKLHLRVWSETRRVYFEIRAPKSDGHAWEGWGRVNIEESSNDREVKFVFSLPILE